MWSFPVHTVHKLIPLQHNYGVYKGTKKLTGAKEALWEIYDLCFFPATNLHAAYQDVPVCYGSAPQNCRWEEKLVALKDALLFWLTSVSAEPRRQPGFTRTAEVFHYLVSASREAVKKTETALCCFLIPLPALVTVSIHRIQKVGEAGPTRPRGSLVQGEVKVWPLIKRPDFISSWCGVFFWLFWFFWDLLTKLSLEATTPLTTCFSLRVFELLS